MTELGPEVLDWIERVTGGRDVETQLVTSGGRLGYRVDVTVDGARRPLFLQRGRNPGTGSFMGFAREAEVYRALEPLGVKVAHVWGVDEALNVLLVDRLDGTVWFQEPPDPQQLAGQRQQVDVGDRRDDEPARSETGRQPGSAVSRAAGAGR